MSLDDALTHYREYFEDKLRRHGAAPQGVDYNGPEAQRIRFDQLIRILDPEQEFEVLDYGCGYGALLAYLKSRDWKFRYHGFDMLESMVRAAKEEHSTVPNADFTWQEADLRPVEYVIAGAIFNNKFEASVDDWREYSLEVLDRLNALGTKGVAFNMLSSYSDADRMATRPDLYFGDPLFYFDYCKRNFSSDVSLLHDYGLYDFTILIRRSA